MSFKVKNALKNSFPALTHKDFRYFWLGSCVSVIGTWMQNAGQAWLVVTLTDSAMKLSVVNALQFTPILLFSLFAGAVIDRYPKKKLLMFTQSSMAVLAGILAFLVFTNKIQYWHILVLATLLGCCNAVDMPTRQSFMIEMVGKGDLMNAIALNSSMFNGARMIGPGIAGLAIKFLGFTICFFLNAISFIPLIWSIYKISAKGLPKEKDEKKNILQDVGEGLEYIYKTPAIFRTILLIGIVGTFAMNYNVLIPLQAKQVLMKGSDGYGFLMSSMGLGSLIAALFVAVKSKKPKKKLLFISASLIGTILAVIGVCRYYSLCALLLFTVGIFNVLFSTNANSTLQLTADNAYRGRVMSVYALVFAGVAPIGSLFEGVVSSRFGVTYAFVISGIATLVLTLMLLVGELRRKA